MTTHRSLEVEEHRKRAQDGREQEQCGDPCADGGEGEQYSCMANNLWDLGTSCDPHQEGGCDPDLACPAPTCGPSGANLENI